MGVERGSAPCSARFGCDACSEILDEVSFSPLLIRSLSKFHDRILTCPVGGQEYASIPTGESDSGVGGNSTGGGRSGQYSPDLRALLQFYLFTVRFR